MNRVVTSSKAGVTVTPYLRRAEFLEKSGPISGRDIEHWVIIIFLELYNTLHAQLAANIIESDFPMGQVMPSQTISSFDNCTVGFK